MLADLTNALFFFILLPNHIVHLIQPLTGLFVCLQFHLAVLEGCLGKKNTKLEFIVSFLNLFWG